MHPFRARSLAVECAIVTNHNEKPAVRTKLTPTPEGLALVIDRATLEALGLNDETEVNVRVEGRCLIIEPTASHRARVREATERVIADHTESLRKLSK